MSADPFDSDTGRAAALTRWAHESDPTAATEKARRTFLSRFEDEVDPDRTLPAEEREIRARRLLRAHMIRIAKKSRKKKLRAV